MSDLRWAHEIILRLCGQAGCPLFPEVLEAVIEVGASEGVDGVGDAYGSVRTVALEPLVNDVVAASGFDDAGGYTEALGAELRVDHAQLVAGEVLGVPVGFLAGIGMAEQGGVHLTPLLRVG